MRMVKLFLQGFFFGAYVRTFLSLLDIFVIISGFNFYPFVEP